MYFGQILYIFLTCNLSRGRSNKQTNTANGTTNDKRLAGVRRSPLKRGA